MKFTKAVWFYLVGLVAFIIAMLLPENMLLVRNLEYTLTVLLAGYHVIWEGVSDTVSQSINQHKFIPNIHILMLLAALGSMIIGSFQEAALLILIFAGEIGRASCRERV